MRISDFVIAETENWIALNKPSGLLSIPDREGKEVSLKKLLIEKYGSIFTVHRLDKDTSGLIVFAKNETAHKHLSLQFENRSTTKIYQGIVIGSPQNKKETINASIMEHPVKKGTMVINRKGKEAITDYEVLEDFGIYSLLQFQIHTGRTHQIRIHMKDLGHPIACDEVYGDGKTILLSSFKKKFNLAKNVEEEKPILGRLGLHSQKLSFTDIDGKKHELEAELPKDFRALLQQLRKWKR
ncbi:MAG: RNA pseudouridine synthase [Bacteroidetes bacterium]|nr:MAG: RNA pseudouridine synthase [Bacteroidota bacterium]